MKDRVLTFEQMQHLGELGVDISSNPNRINYYYDWFDNPELVYEGTGDGICRAFTLEDIFELLPFYLTINGNHYHLEWCDTTELRYEEDDYDGKPDTLVQKDEGNLLDTAYEMLVYLLENNITKPA